MEMIALSKIRLDGGTQPRAYINETAVMEYAEEMQSGAIFPPVILFSDGQNYWLADGFHRVNAAKKANRKEIEAEIKKGEKRDAVLFSVGANASHGMRRTNADKRRAVLTLLNDKEWRRWPQTKIASVCVVSAEYVSRLKTTLSIDRSVDKVEVIRNGTTYSMQTANIGKSAVEIEDNIEWEGDEEEVDLNSPEYRYGYDYGQAYAASKAGYDVALPDPSTYGLSENIEVGLEIGWNGPIGVVKPHVAKNSGNNEWYTPAEYIEAAMSVLGRIDLDPASSSIANRTVKAESFYTSEDDGLSRQWNGRIWMNPPYAADLIGLFTEKLVSHYRAGEVTEALVLVNNATETSWFQTLANVAASICFPKSRIKFLDAEGNPGAPLQGQAVIYLGRNPKRFRDVFAGFGFTVEL